MEVDSTSMTMDCSVEKELLQEEERKPTFEKESLVWVEDLQVYSRFLDIKELLTASHLTYFKHHPELKALIQDFLLYLLLRKPEDIFTFAADFFVQFSSRNIPFRKLSTRPFSDEDS
ncbi:ciliogenesis-associated TTC17-interacting protein-like isoform X2 [Erpetoichthys calabaricus]|uniref:ciliogenesis-associated TTC17-interacting protein-like isoform X2 n=1 Tax=Erpetoichthys calabaricus TaxID=27687 RepID=UPI0022343226|nr:ciliogenesis-associated TTC17-interacting protein-like isoform X2 [Erpetoichthys calabaricus]